ncbi:MAG: 2-C-methyl-D-erythritol 2,4-cyclodiphosphate synthase [Treponemataceae bacterium]
MFDFSVILCCAGKSTRFGMGEKKEYLPLSLFTKQNSLSASDFSSEGISVISESVYKFLAFKNLKNIVILIPSGDKKKVQKILQQDFRLKEINFTDNTKAEHLNYTSSKKQRIYFVEGGKTRQLSVFNGLQFLVNLSETEKTPYVLIHDAARPFFSSALVENILEKLKTFDAVVPGLPPVDTQKQIDDNFCIKANLERKFLRAVQTPQAFKLAEIYQANLLVEKIADFTDDSEIFFQAFPEKKIYIIDGETSNTKITYASDAINIKQKKLAISCKEKNFTPQANLRIGLGYDLHRLVKDKPLILGGVLLKSDKGFLAHSDGDVLLHAIIDALLGAVGFSDIGSLFPPTEKKWKGASSVELLKLAWATCNAKKAYAIQNIDCVLVMESPKLLPYREKIRTSIAETLNLKSEQVFVKAKTAEKTGIVGAGEAIEAYATALVLVK